MGEPTPTASAPSGAAPSAPGSAAPPSFREAFGVWLKIGLLSFGGPAGQIALMHRLLVEEKRWIDEARFLHALNYCMLLPGPEAQQLAIYVGWLLHRIAGGIVAGALFVLPGAAVILALSILYAEFRDLSFVEALFFGVKAAVLAVVAEAVLRIGRRALKSRYLIAIAAAAFIAIFFLAVPFPVIVIGAGVLGYIGARSGVAGTVAPPAHGPQPEEGASPAETVIGVDVPPHARPSAARALKIAAVCLALWFVPIAALAALLGPGHVYIQASLFFSLMAVVTFGGAYAVLAYVAQQAVETYGWLAPGEMLDGLGLAETTPGPLILVVQFVGFLAGYRSPGGLDPVLAGSLGAALTTWVTFVPCFLWIFLGAPYIERLRGHRALGGALTAITVAVVGVILNLAVWFGVHVLFADVATVWAGPLRLLVPAVESLDWPALGLTAFAFAALFGLKLGMVRTLLAAAALGVALSLLGLRI